jgi:chitinase
MTESSIKNYNKQLLILLKKIREKYNNKIEKLIITIKSEKDYEKLKHKIRSYNTIIQKVDTIINIIDNVYTQDFFSIINSYDNMMNKIPNETLKKKIYIID